MKGAYAAYTRPKRPGEYGVCGTGDHWCARVQTSADPEFQLLHIPERGHPEHWEDLVQLAEELNAIFSRGAAEALAAERDAADNDDLVVTVDLEPARRRLAFATDTSSDGAYPEFQSLNRVNLWYYSGPGAEDEWADCNGDGVWCGVVDGAAGTSAEGREFQLFNEPSQGADVQNKALFELAQQLNAHLQDRGPDILATHRKATEQDEGTITLAYKEEGIQLGFAVHHHDHDHSPVGAAAE